jgi:hypothetical protein
MTIIEQIEQRKKFLNKGILNSLSNQEVITPISLVEEMLDKLPEDIWKNPDLTWADPCSKSGSFPLEIIYRLMKNLPIESETLRYEHIINNMVSVYVNADRNKWVVAKAVYGDVSEVGKLKLLEIDKLKENDMPKFDIITTNYPFQPVTENRGSSKGSGAMLWPDFVNITFNELTHDESIILAISPSKWRLGNFTKSKARTASNHIWKYEISNVINVSDKFNGIAEHQALDCWIVNKGEKNCNQEIFQKYHFLPLQNKELIKDYLLEFDKATEFYFQDIPGHDYRAFKAKRKSKLGDREHPYKYLNTYSQFKEGFYDWYNEKVEGFDKKKVIITKSVNLSTPGNKLAIFDSAGEIGTGHNASGFSVKNKEDGIKLTNFLNNSNIIKSLIKEYNGPGGYIVPLALFQKIPKTWVERFDNGENL